MWWKVFTDTRRMKRNAALAASLRDPVRQAVGLPVGLEGGYFVGNPKDYGQTHDATVVDYNGPPTGQPGLWCGWTPHENGTAIEWNGAEKFYKYKVWIVYLIEHFLKPWGYTLNGDVTWQGEDMADRGTMSIRDNVLLSARNEIMHEP